MYVVQGDSAVNIGYCLRIYVQHNEIKAETDIGIYKIATFDTAEQAKEYLSLILKAYTNGDKVFYC